MRTYSVPDCERPHVGRGLCALHLQRKVRGTDLLAPTQRRRPKAPLGGSRWTSAEITAVEDLALCSLDKRLPAGSVAALARRLCRTEAATTRQLTIVRRALREKQ